MATSWDLKLFPIPVFIHAIVAMPLDAMLERETPINTTGFFEHPTYQKGPFPEHLKQYLNYGPEFGVQHSTIASHPKNFDDTDYLGIPGDSEHYRQIQTFACWRTAGYEGNVLAGEKARYAYNKNKILTNYHGWTGFLAFIGPKQYTLDVGEHFHEFTIRACDGRFWGINAVTTKRGPNNGVACGRYWLKKGDKNCEVKVLRADPGYYIIGLYGDGNGVLRTRDQGLRGLGLITMKVGH